MPSRIKRKRTRTTTNPRASKRINTGENEPPELQSQHSQNSQSPGPATPPGGGGLPEIRRDMEQEELYQAAQQYAARLQDLQREQREAGRDALANITNEREAECEPDVEADQLAFVYAKGKEIAYTTMLWIPVGHEDEVFAAELDPAYNPLERFEPSGQPKNKIQGAARALRDAVPEEFQTETEWCGWVQTEIERGTRYERSTIANRLRGNPALFGETGADFATSDTREKYRKFIGYREDKRGKPVYDPFDVDFLHEDYQGEFDIDKFLRNERLFAAHAAITNGLGGAFAMINGTKPPKAQTIGKLWGLKKTTPEMIAACAIFVCWVHSRDQEFLPIGDVTKIHWEEHYEKYLRWLYRGLADKVDCVVELFRIWDEKFYPQWMDEAGDGEQTPTAADESTDVAMDALANRAAAA
ncbi:hypothetical protein MKEN_00553100 [Mycena kentingensis (nom. inval.)]|nr:hypothetical protein MKEN_00553100 [Mycena kentingensis (nom. inval.)]